MELQVGQKVKVSELIHSMFNIPEVGTLRAIAPRFSEDGFPYQGWQVGTEIDFDGRILWVPQDHIAEIVKEEN